MKKEVLEKKNKELEEKLEEGIRECLKSDKFKRWLNVVAKFHNYSANNCLLIALQRPDATYVASYRKWEQMKRNVNAGEKGIMIMTPCNKEYTAFVTKQDADGKPELDTNGNPVKIPVKKKYTMFKPGYIFDVSQTSGEPLPEICQELSGDVEDYEMLKNRIIGLATIPVFFEDEVSGGVKGCCSSIRILIKSGLSEIQTIKTLIHEVAHHRLGHCDERSSLSKERKEIEAESVAYLLSAKLGLSTEEYSFEYLASWTGKEEDLKKFKESLGKIQKCVDTLYSELADNKNCKKTA